MSAIISSVAESTRATDQERHLCREGELVGLEEAPRRVREDEEGDGVDEGQHAQLHVVVHLREVDGVLEHDGERLRAERHVSATTAPQTPPMSTAGCR